MNQNWSLGTLSQGPPKRTSYVWVWSPGGCVVFPGLIAAAVMFVASQIPAGKSFREWLAESASTDDSDDSAFAAKASILEFKDRVRKAPSLNFTGRREFRSQFDEWFTMYCPNPKLVSGMQFVSVKRHPADHTLIAYTWVFDSTYPERVPWYLRSNGQEIWIVDYENLDSSAMESDATAREFSAAFAGEVQEIWEFLGGDLLAILTNLASLNRLFLLFARCSAWPGRGSLPQKFDEGGVK